MTLHAWAEHVVHVDLVSRDQEISRTAARFLEQRFRTQDVEVVAEPGELEVHSDPEDRVGAAQVAQALVEAGVRAHAVHEREEWGVADV